MNHINPQHDNTTSTNTNAPTWRILRERRQDPFHFMISRPQPVNTALPLPPPPPPMSTLPISPESSSLDDSRKNRRVIASKRAAQNRAAQKAFRQRRDQYIKELEEQAKEAKESKQELNELRQENAKLKERVTALEHHIILLTGKPVDEKALQNIHIPVTSIASPQPSSQTSITEQQQQQQQQQNAEPDVTPPLPPPTTATTVVKEQVKKKGERLSSRLNMIPQKKPTLLVWYQRLWRTFGRINRLILTLRLIPLWKMNLE
ncbi:hypothetical protein RMCBS344292_11997 [Rhizopus microsporus]|nr:hypothetical protein RMCBS344292_11997 [Rhizopus microsporus]